MHVSLDDKTFIGVETQDLKFKGLGYIVHGSGAESQREPFTVEGPIKNFRLTIDVKNEKASKHIGIKDILFEIDGVATSVKATGNSKVFEEHGHVTELKQFVEKDLLRVIT